MQRHFSPSNLISLISNPSEEEPARVRNAFSELTFSRLAKVPFRFCFPSLLVIRRKELRVVPNSNKSEFLDSKD